VLYIGTDNFKAGKESLKQMAALVPSGSIVVITIPGQRNLDDRMAGVADALKEFFRARVVETLPKAQSSRRRDSSALPTIIDRPLGATLGRKIRKREKVVWPVSDTESANCGF